MHLEAMRRGFIGGSSLALFIIKDFGLEKGAVPTLNAMNTYLEHEEKLLSQIPLPLKFLVTPFTDHHDAAMTFFLILDILTEMQRPRTCQYYWEKAAE